MATFRVSNQSQLEAAVRGVRGGDTIVLASGTYAKLEMNALRRDHGHVDFDKKVVVTTENFSKPAIVNQMFLRGAENVEIRGITFDYNPARTNDKPFWVENSRSVVLNDVNVEGHVVGKYGAGLGILIKSSNDVKLINSDISNFSNGVHSTNSNNIQISNNNLKAMSNDSMLFGGMNNVRITDNSFTNMKSDPNRQHKDAIQFMTSGSEGASKNIYISDNIVNNPEVTHGFFFGNFLARSGNNNASYQNVIIEDNYIRGAHKHGITIEHGAGVTIKNNTLIQNPDLGYRADVNVPIINISNSSSAVKIIGNKVASVPDANRGWEVYGNTTGSRDLKHWDGINMTLNSVSSAPGGAAVSLANASPALMSNTEPREHGNELGWITKKVNSFGSAYVEGSEKGKMFKLDALDLNDDILVFRSFEQGTFDHERGGNRYDIWGNGGAVKLDSIVDLRELVSASDDVSAVVSADTLFIKIDQSQGEDINISLDGLGREFLAVNPDLF